MAIIGLANLHYAKMLSEDTATSAAVYEKPKRLIGINSVSISPTVDTATLYGDNKALATLTNSKEYQVTLEIADLPPEDEAALLGHKIDDDGIIHVAGNDTSPYIAILFDADTHHDNEKMYVKFFKGKFSPSQQDLNTRGENLEFGLHSLEATFVTRMYDDLTYDKFVTTDTTVAKSWYAEV